MYKLNLIALVLLSTVVGCASSPATPTSLEYVAFDQVRANPGEFDGKTTNIKGYIQADALGTTSLYANADDAAKNRMYDAIDILSKNVELREKIKYTSPTCVIASGKFRTYKPGEFKFDMPSKIGVIELENVVECEK